MSINFSNTNDAYKTIIKIHNKLDNALWFLEDKASLESHQTLMVNTAYNKAKTKLDTITNNQQFSFDATIKKSIPLLQRKIDLLSNQILKITKAPAHASMSGKEIVFETKNPTIQTPSKAPQVLSYTITQPSKTEQTAPSISSVLNRISYLLRHEKEADALNEFNQLPQEVKGAIYGALWIVRGRPSDQNPIAHLNFGEVSFLNQEHRCYSTPKQKACAVELFKTQASIREMIALFEQNNSTDAIKIFHTLPPQIQNEIYGMHWIACGKPTPDSKDEYLKSIAHIDFGKVSFLGLEERCNVGAENKAKALKEYLPHLIVLFDKHQKLIEQTLSDWKNIDSSNQPGQQKNTAKKTALISLAAAIVPSFLGHDFKVQIPTPINPQTQKPRESHTALAAAYVEQYPCLKPFFLQLENDLSFDNEKLEDCQMIAFGAPKPSKVTVPDLKNMGHQQRKQYLVGIMQDTLQTLQAGYYINSQGKKISLNFQPSIDSLSLEAHDGGNSVRKGNFQTTLFLDHMDCLTVTRDLAERGLNPIVLDAASDGHFGGGYKTGAAAQEENMCRRSGLCFAVDPTQSKQKKDFYPLSKHGEHAGLYVSNVPVFRGEEAEGYPYLDTPFETAVAVMAAYNFNEQHNSQLKLKFNQQTNELFIPEPQATETKNKLRTILHMAVQKGHESIVLMPLGCGAFRNPPKHVSGMLMDLITEEFPNSFKEIHISIIDDHNTGKAHNPNGNYAVFKTTIENSIDKMKKFGMTYKNSSKQETNYN